MDLIYDVIEAMNTLIDKTAGEFIIHKSMRQHPKFKAIKIYSYKLYLVNTQNKEVILEKEISKNTSLDSIIDAWKEADKEFLPNLLEYISSNHFNKFKK